MASPLSFSSAKPVRHAAASREFCSRPGRRTTLAAAVRNSSWKAYGVLDSVDTPTAGYHSQGAPAQREGEEQHVFPTEAAHTSRLNCEVL